MFAELFAEAWKSMMANRVRSLLTMLGLLIGVGAVVVMMSFGQGAQYAVEKSIQSMGSNLLIVLSGNFTSGGARSGFGSSPTLLIEDINAIGELPNVANAVPLHIGNAQTVYGAKNYLSSIIGSTPAFLSVRAWRLSSGDSFTDNEVKSSARVALVGKNIVENLFPGEDEHAVIGKVIRIINNPFIVIGVLSKKGQSLDGRNQDDTILIPITTAQRQLFGTPFVGKVRMAQVQADNDKAMGQVENSISELLRTRHKIRDGQDDDFQVRNMSAMLDVAASSIRSLSILLGAIASISLIVGGIGIMNIMLVSVTERTREIGLRMAVGATSRDILTQFLLEAIMISLAGGILGLLLGASLAYLVGMVQSQFTLILSGTMALIAFAVSVGIGIFFGYYPAKKAARLDPIEALRYQ